MSDEVRNTIIIGSGPAGYTAGLYSARAMLKPLMFLSLLMLKPFMKFLLFYINNNLMYP